MSDEETDVQIARDAVDRRSDLVDRLNAGDSLALLELLEEAGGKITGPVTVRVVPSKETPIAQAG